MPAGRRAIALDPKNAYLATALAELRDIEAIRPMKRALAMNPGLRAAAEDADIVRAFAS